jgi:DnaJ-class molecular chaperone
MVHVAAHPFFSRKGNDLYVRLPVTLNEAVSGGAVEIPSPGGTVTMQIPAGTSSGKKLRVKGQGVAMKGTAAGDLFAEVQIMLPPKLDESEREAIREIDSRHPIHPRHGLRW